MNRDDIPPMTAEMAENIIAKSLVMLETRLKAVEERLKNLEDYLDRQERINRDRFITAYNSGIMK